MVDDRHVNGAHHALRHGARTGDLQEVTAGGVGHGELQVGRMSWHGNPAPEARQHFLYAKVTRWTTFYGIHIKYMFLLIFINCREV
jgi:hypothetical protein